MTVLHCLFVCIDLLLLFSLYAAVAIRIQQNSLLSRRFTGLSLHAFGSDLYNKAIPNLVKTATNSSKAHVNKYKQFSKNLKDPLLIKVSNISNTANGNPAKIIIKNRGKTVPVTQSVALVSPSLNVSTSIKTLRNSSISSYPAAAVKMRNLVGRKVSSVEPLDPYSFGYSELGSILNPHGIRGEVKLQSSTDVKSIQDLQLGSGSTVYVKKPNRRTPRPIRLKAIRRQNNDIFLLSFENVNSRDMAESFKGYNVYIRKSDRPTIESDEYRIRDLVGMKCYIFATTPFQNSTNAVTELSVEHYIENCLPVGLVEGVVPPDELCSPEMAKLMHSLIELRLFPIGSTRSRTNINDWNDDVDSDQLNSDVMCLVPFVPSIVKIIDNDRKVLVFDPPIGLLDLTYREKKKYVIRGYLPYEVTTLSVALRKELEMSTILIPSLPSLTF